MRGCGRALQATDRRLACDAGHSYDIARSGYVNLLQPQDRRSLDAGDSREIVEARSRLFSAGVGHEVVAAIAARLTAMPWTGGAQLVDVGSGSGDALASIVARCGGTGIGIDLSSAAVEHAARRYPALTWVVANGDRHLPLPDASTRAVMSIHARRKPSEAHRVLEPDGLLLIALPAPDDLAELRTAIHGESIPRDRVEALIAEHTGLFRVVEQATIRTRHRLEGPALRDLLRISYRGARHRAASHVDDLAAMDVTLSSDVVAFGPRR